MSKVLSIFASPRENRGFLPHKAHRLLRSASGPQAVRISPKVFCDPKMPKAWRAEELDAGEAA